MLKAYGSQPNGFVSAPVTIVAHLEADSTFNADTAPGKGVLPAGTLMKYDPVTMTLATAAVGTDQLCDILADIVDTGPVGIPEILPAMIYRKGVFLRKEIEEANGITITPGSAVDLALNDLGIFLELGYEDES